MQDGSTAGVAVAALATIGVIARAAIYYARATAPRPHTPPPATRPTHNPAAPTHPQPSGPARTAPPLDPARRQTLAALDVLIRGFHGGTVTRTEYESGIRSLLRTLPPPRPHPERDADLITQAIDDTTNLDKRLAQPAAHYLIGRTTPEQYQDARAAALKVVGPQDAVPPPYV
jgi:hypothetical protein